MTNIILRQLILAFQEIRSISDKEIFLKTILSYQEIDQIPKRLEILKRLYLGQPQDKILKELHVSKETISRGSNVFKLLQEESPRWWNIFKTRVRSWNREKI